MAGIEPPFDSPPTLAGLVELVDDTRARWHMARTNAESAERAYLRALRDQVDAEAAHRAALARYETERVQAT